MLLPTSYGAALLTLALAALFWSTWANLQRADRKWRFELFAFDFALGGIVCALLLALTVGNAGSTNNFTFDETLTVASKRNMATAFAGGAIYCIGNMMVFAAIVLAGMSTALPVAAGMGLLLVTLLSGNPDNAALHYGGAGTLLAALAAAAMAQKTAAAETPAKTGMHPGWKGFILACVGGAIIGIALPLVESSRGGEIGVGAYGASVFMAFGLLAMTPLVNVYFLNLPVQGEALPLKAFLKGTKKQHLMGFLGGALWAGGTVAFFVSAGGAFPGAPKFLAMEAAVQGGAVAGAICGLTLWGEQAGAPKAKLMLMGAMALLAGGAAMVFAGG